MYYMTVSAHFSAAHSLRDYDGPCKELHGHNYKLKVKLKGAKLDELGMLIDYKVVKETLNEVLSVLDHGYLNNIAPFDFINPTSENIAKYLHDELKNQIPLVYEVVVFESDGQGVAYSEE